MTRLPSAAAILVLALTLMTHVSQAAKTKIFPFPVDTRVMDNGLKVVMVPFDSPGIVAYYTIARVGSRNEVDPGRSGFAHFFEHMMFRGTEKYPTTAYNELFKVLGSDANAFTSDDVTVFHSLFGTGGLERVIDAESDRFMNLEYSETDFRQEAKAVLGEYNKNYSNPIRKLFEKLRDTAWDRHPYKHTTMGFIHDIIDMPNQYDYSRRFFARYYTPDNVVVLIVGDFQPDNAWALVRKYYGKWNKKTDPAVIPRDPPQTAPRKGHIEWDNPTLPYLAMAYKVPAFDARTTDCAALDILSRLVFGRTSTLYQALVVNERKVEWISAQFPDRRDPTLFTVLAKIKSDDDIDYVRGQIEQAIQKAQTAPPDATRLEAVKSNIRYGFAMSLDTAASVASHLAHYIGLTGQPGTVNAIYQRYAEVTPGDVQRVAQTYLTRNRSTRITLTGAKR